MSYCNGLTYQQELERPLNVRFEKALSENVIDFEEGEYYVYVWKDGFGNPFYVGSGKGKRFENVYGVACRSQAFLNIYRTGNCKPEIVACGLPVEDAREIEADIIADYREKEVNLVNATLRG